MSTTAASEEVTPASQAEALESYHQATQRLARRLQQRHAPATAMHPPAATSAPDAGTGAHPSKPDSTESISSMPGTSGASPTTSSPASCPAMSPCAPSAGMPHPPPHGSTAHAHETPQKACPQEAAQTPPACDPCLPALDADHSRTDSSAQPSHSAEETTSIVNQISQHIQEQPEHNLEAWTEGGRD